MACIAALQGGFGALWLTQAYGFAPVAIGLCYVVGSLLGAACVSRPTGRLPRLVALAHAIAVVVIACVLWAHDPGHVNLQEASAVVAGPACMANLAFWLCVCPRWVMTDPEPERAPALRDAPR